MSRNALVFAVVALVGGGALGYLLGQGASPPPPAAPDGGREEAGDVWRPDRQPGSPTDDEPAPRSALDVPRGDGVITGRVAKESGEGVPGATVRATLAPPPRGDDDGSAPRAEDRIEALLHEARLARASRREAMTGADGAFRLGGLADRPYRLEAFKRGHTLTSARADRIRPGQTVDFVAKPRILLPVTVELPDGGEPEEAKLSVGSPGRMPSMPYYPGMPRSQPGRTWLPDRRSIALAPGSHELSASAGLFGELRSERVRVTVRENETPEEVVLRLEARPGVRGTVRFADGVVEKGSITVALIPAGRTEEPADTEFHRGRRAVANPGRGFAYVHADVEPGEYWLGAMVNYEVRAKERVTVAESMVEQDLVLPAPGPGETLTVRVLDPDGEAVSGVVFRLERRIEGEGNRSGSVGMAQLPDGTYRLRTHSAFGKGSIEGRVFLVVLTSDAGVAEVEVDLDDPTPVTVVLQDTSTLVVTVEGLRPGQEKDLYISAARLAAMGQLISDRRSGYNAKVDPEGRRTFERLQPGTYRLYVGIRSGLYGHQRLEQRDVVVGPGENRESVVLPPLHELTVIVGEEFKGTLRISSSSDQYGGYLGQPSGGRFRIANLPAGLYGLVMHTEEGERGMTVNVPSRSEVVFEGKPLTAMRVRIRDEDGKLAQSALVADDLIVGVAGETFENAADMRGKLMVASQKSPARLSVIRGGRRVEVSVDGELLGQRQDLGGWLEATAR